MAHHVEPMDVDDMESDFDNKENTYHHTNVLPRTPCTEKGYEELDVSELNMKLRYSFTPAASPMTKSCTAQCLDNRYTSADDTLNNTVTNENDNNLTRSLHSTLNKTDCIKSPKVLPLQMIPTTEPFVESSKNSTVLQPLDSTVTNGNNVTITVSGENEIDNLSFPSSSSSLSHTPEATTPTKEIPKNDGGSPILRGIKSVLNMFRSSQSPIPPSEGDEAHPIEGTPKSDKDPQSMLSSTPLNNKREGSLSKSSPHKESIVFNDDLEKELKWSDDSTILFSNERIPIHKLFFQDKPFPKQVKSDVAKKEEANSTVEYMDISYNDQSIRDKTLDEIINKNKASDVIESDGEFVDCETTFTKNESLPKKVELENNTTNNDVLPSSVEKNLQETFTEESLLLPDGSAPVSSLLPNKIVNTELDFSTAAIVNRLSDLIDESLSVPDCINEIANNDTLNLSDAKIPDMVNTDVNDIPDKEPSALVEQVTNPEVIETKVCEEKCDNVCEVSEITDNIFSSDIDIKMIGNVPSTEPTCVSVTQKEEILDNEAAISGDYPLHYDIPLPIDDDDEFNDIVSTNSFNDQVEYTQKNVNLETISSPNNNLNTDILSNCTQEEIQTNLNLISCNDQPNNVLDIQSDFDTLQPLDNVTNDLPCEIPPECNKVEEIQSNVDELHSDEPVNANEEDTSNFSNSRQSLNTANKELASSIPPESTIVNETINIDDTTPVSIPLPRVDPLIIANDAGLVKTDNVTLQSPVVTVDANQTNVMTSHDNQTKTESAENDFNNVSIQRESEETREVSDIKSDEEIIVSSESKLQSQENMDISYTTQNETYVDKSVMDVSTAIITSNVESKEDKPTCQIPLEHDDIALPFTEQLVTHQEAINYSKNEERDETKETSTNLISKEALIENANKSIAEHEIDNLAQPQNEEANGNTIPQAFNVNSDKSITECQMKDPTENTNESSAGEKVHEQTAITLCNVDNLQNNVDESENISVEQVLSKAPMTDQKSNEIADEPTLLTKSTELKVSDQENADEEILLSENNSPFVSVSVDFETEESKVKKDFVEIENPFNTNSKIRQSPPASPKIVSKGYNFNFDDIDSMNPFATKTKIRMSPPPGASPNKTFESDETKKIHENFAPFTNKTKNINRRKSMPEKKKAFKNSSNFNATFDCANSIPIKQDRERNVINTSPEININNEETYSVNKSKIADNAVLLSNLESAINEDRLENVTISEDAIEKSETKLSELAETTIHIDQSTSDKDESRNNVVENAALMKLDTSSKILDVKASVDTDKNSSSSEQSTYFSAGTSSSEFIESKNVFNLPEIDDKDFNPFATKSKMRQTPPPDLNVEDPFATKSKIRCTPDSSREDFNATVTRAIDKDPSENLSDTSSASKATDENNVTIQEVHTEDEDTIEGPFLEAEDFKDGDDGDMANFENRKSDMIDFNSLSAQMTDDNVDPGEMFIDAEAFEFLMNQNKSDEVAYNGKESLFLKFDPLFARRVTSEGVVAALNDIKRRQSTPKKMSQQTKPVVEELQPLGKPIAVAGPSSLNITNDIPNVLDDNRDDMNVTVSKPMMAVTPAVNPVVTPRKKSLTPNRTNRLSMTITSPAIAVIDRLLSLSANNSPTSLDRTVTQANREHTEAEQALTQLRELLAEKEINVYNLRCESKELKNRLSDLESQMKALEAESAERLKKVNELNDCLAEKTKSNRSMAATVEEYERTIAILIADIEQDKKRNAEERNQLIRERDEQTAHLASMEVSFSDLHSKYEKSKQVILGYKSNEDAYKTSIKEFEDNLAKMQSNYELLKQHATSKLNHANQELEKLNKSHDADVLKLNAMIKRKDLHITSLEETLAQKIKANEELTAICDELINKVG